MPPRKKEPVSLFPPESCGACHYCRVMDDEDRIEFRGHVLDSDTLQVG